MILHIGFTTVMVTSYDNAPASSPQLTGWIDDLPRRHCLGRRKAPLAVKDVDIIIYII